MVRPHSFKEGDLYPKNLSRCQGPEMEMYKEPYVVKCILSEGALILTNSGMHKLIHLTQTWSNYSIPKSSIEKESKGLTPNLQDGGVSTANTRGIIINSQLKALGLKLVLTRILFHGIPQEGLMLINPFDQ
ncbi:hypothetical protein CR513_19391, partial [Mucuna pruriens]